VSHVVAGRLGPPVRQAITTAHTKTRWHFLFAWLFRLNGILYGGFSVLSGRFHDLTQQ